MHSCCVKLAIEIELDRAPTMEIAATSAMAVESSGSSAASIEPNTTSSTTSAAATPIRVLICGDELVDAATCPRTSTCRVWLPGARAVLTNVVAAEAEIAVSALLNCTVANATVPLRLICLDPDWEYGEVTRATFGRCATLASIGWI